MNIWDKIKGIFGRDNKFSGALAVLLFAGLATALLLIVRAAGPFVALEGEDATNSGTVIKSDANASGGEYAQFVGQTTPPPPPPSGSCTGVSVAAGANLITIANNNAAGTTFCLAAGQYNLTGTGIPLQNGDKWIGALSSTGARLSILDGGDSATKAFTCTCSGGEIKNIIIEDFNSAVQSQPMGPAITDWLWDNIESRENATRGFFTWNGTILRNSYIHHNHALGIGGNGDGVLVENTEVSYNNYLGETMPGFEGGGSKWTNAVGVTVRDSFFHHNCGGGIWFDGSGNFDALIENNVSEDNWSAGVFIELFGGNATVANNIVNRNTFGNSGPICQNTPGGESSGAGNGGIRANASHDVEIYGNTLSGNDGGISSTQDDRRSVEDLNIHDNDVTWSVGWTGVQDTSGGTIPSPFTTAANNHFENNDYHYNGSGTTPFKWLVGDRTWAQWQSYGHDDTGSFD